jgi:hypothetical protein
VLNSSGNLGIGTNSPTSGFKLDVIGDARFSDVAGDDGVEMGWSAGGSKGFVQAYDRNASAFRTLSLNNALDIDSSGNLGLGVTPSAWTLFKALEIGNVGTYISGRPSGNQLNLAVNTYYNSGSKYANTGAAATMYEQEAGAHKWYTAPSGTAGNAISFTQAMTLDASGALMVGGTNNDPFSRAFTGTRTVLGNNSGETGLTFRSGTGTTSFLEMGSGSTFLFSLSCNASGTQLQTTTTVPLIFSTNSGERARISSDGTFRVKGAGTAGSTDAVQFSGSAPASAMTLDASGNLEIGGTFAFGRKLGVDSSTDGYTVGLVQTGAFDSGKTSGLVFTGYYDGSSLTDMASIRGGKENTTSGNFGGMLAFYTRPNGGSDTERARITSGGNLLVGTTTDIGGANARLVVDHTGSDYGLMLNTATSAGPNILVFRNSNNNGEARLVNNTGGPLTFYRTTTTEAARITSDGYFLIGLTTTTGSGKFTNYSDSAATAGVSSGARVWNQIKNTAASNNATVDAWIGRDAGGNVIANLFLVGHFYVYVAGASGANSFSGVYSIVTTGNGTSQATLAAVSTVSRGTNPVSSIQIANDGVSGAIKLTVTYINNSGIVNGGNSEVSFVGQLSAT